MKTYIVKLSNGQYMGNLISGPKGHSFVRVEKEYACQMLTEAFAKAAAVRHGVGKFTIEPNDYTP